jgi:hypothetical protein
MKSCTLRDGQLETNIILFFSSLFAELCIKSAKALTFELFFLAL